MNTAKKCAGCCELLRKDYLICHKCNDYYDLLCANLKPKKFSQMNKEHKNSWMCQACLSKIPKRDNTNTPLRGGTIHTSQALSLPVSSNVTNRNKNREHRRNENLTNPLNEDLNLIPASLEPEVINKLNSMTCSLSKDEIKSLVRDEMKSVLADFQASLFKNLDAKNKDFIEQIEQVTLSLNFIEEKYEQIRLDVNNKFESLRKLEAENIDLKKTVTDLSSRLVQIEQHPRTTNVELHCIPEHKSENLVTVIKQIANVTNYQLNETDIHLCTRISKLDKSSTRPRSVLVKFSSPRVRDGFLASTISFNKKTKDKSEKLNTSHLGIAGDRQPIYVMEHLSPALKSLHAATRLKAKEKGYKFVWIKAGRVYVRKHESAEHKYIKNVESLNSLL